MKKFAFYVSSNATRLKKFLYLYGETRICEKIEFILIDNKRNSELKDICKKKHIQYYEIDTEHIKHKNIYISNLFLNYLEQHNVNYAFVFANRIIEGDLLNIYKNRLINFHPSILPAHKGLQAIDQALEKNTFLLGNTAHMITNELDGGNVIMQNIFPSHEFTNYDEVLDKQLIMILQIMIWIQEDRLSITDKRVIVRDAQYNVAEYIPNLEIKYEN